MRAVVRKALSRGLGLLPRRVSYFIRTLIEKRIFARTPVIHDLPPIFHYWSNGYVRPQLEELGFSSPEHFFQTELHRLAKNREEPLTVVSLGSGRCELEIELTRSLRMAGHELRFTCLDLNPKLLRDGEAAANASGLREWMQFVVEDVNNVRDLGQHDAIIAAQCLHHFVELETILDSVSDALSTDGLFLVSDVIGRNGHQMWPEALEALQALWRKLPPRLRTDTRTGRVLPEYDNVSYADVAFEGIRAQDILPLLVERFEFEVFAPFACLAIPFVDRRFGWNYDADDEFDRALVDDIAATDQRLLEAGKIKPTQLVAALTKGRATRQLSSTHWTPGESIRTESPSRRTQQTEC